jgi:hypothetical protein
VMQANRHQRAVRRHFVETLPSLTNILDVPLALMLCADRIPIESAHFKVQPISCVGFITAYRL